MRMSSALFKDTGYRQTNVTATTAVQQQLLTTFFIKMAALQTRKVVIHGGFPHIFSFVIPPLTPFPRPLFA